MNRTLGSRNVGDLLSETFAIYGKNFLRLVAIVLIVQVPMAIIYNIVGLLPQSVLVEPGALSSITPMDFLIGIPLALASLVAYTIMNGAMIHAISEQYFQRPVNIGRAYRFAWRRTGAMLGAYFLILLAVLGLSITIIGIPAAIYFVVIWIFFQQTAVLEGCGPTAALSRSSALVKKSWWRVLGIGLLFLLLISIIYLIFNFMPTIWEFSSRFTSTHLSMSQRIIEIVCQAVSTIIITPITGAGLTLLYFDLRVRKQGYSLDALANELELATTATDSAANPPV